ncbi:MAG TPA: hypothetical protein VNS46_15895 [Nocardioides sp.]|nr:hypothetical protein [Nocardioides sp.]
MPSAPRRPAPQRGRTTRGPLPPGVYWRRRVFVLGTAFALVFVIARWLTGSSDGASDDAAVAEQAGAQVQATGTVTAGEPTSSMTASPSGRKGGSPTPTLAAPEGTCEASDVVVTPSVVAPAEAGGDVTLTLSLQTTESEACTWQVSRDTVTVRISDGSDVLWTTQQCPAAVPTESVVVRRTVATLVELTWDAKESAARCTSRTNWVWPGEYSLAAAALGGEPTETEFTLVRAVAKTVEVTPKSTATPKATATKKPKKPVN